MPQHYISQISIFDQSTNGTKTSFETVFNLISKDSILHPVSGSVLTRHMFGRVNFELVDLMPGYLLTAGLNL